MEDQDVDRLYKQIFHFFLKRDLRREVAEELTQETFAEAYRKRESFRGEAAFDTWVFAIAKNLWSNYGRSHGAQKRSGTEVSLDSLEVSGAALTASDNPLRNSIDEEEARQVREALAELPPDQRQCVLLQLDQGLRYREIAAILQVSLNQVRSLMFMARAKLKRRLTRSLADSEA